jgi:RNA polymerase sigma factor (sigma-70 family)
VVLLTALPQDSNIVAAVDGGAYGVVLKEFASDVLMDCLREVAAGRKWMPHDVISPALKREKTRSAQLARIEDAITDREREVIRLVAAGLTNKEIARSLGISEGTVKIHLHNVYQKVSVTNRTALATLANLSRRQPDGV